MTDSTATNRSGDSSYESALAALFSPGIHQAMTKEDIARSALRRTRTVSDMRFYWNKVLKAHPQSNEPRKLPLLIHVTGTKGKGSTACMCEAIMRAHGYNTGLFTSPHLIDIRERIRWNGKPIHQDIFADVYWKIRRALESEGDEEDHDDPPPKLPGYFRMLTLMGLYTFLHKLSGKVDVIILEVGMGGRYDATNFLDASTKNFRRVANGVTMLDLDHTRILGDTLEKIAWEKGGIFSVDKLNPNGTCRRPQDDDEKTEASETEKNGSESKKRKSSDSKVRFLSPNNAMLDSNKEGVVGMMKDCALIEGKGSQLTLVDATGAKIKEGLHRKGLSLGLAGSHQYGNATLAVALCQSVTAGEKGQTETIQIDSPTSLGALASAKWPGRCQSFEWSCPNKSKEAVVQFYLDGAHTPQSMDATVEWLRSKSSRTTNAKDEDLPILVFNCSHERNPVELLELFLRDETTTGRCHRRFSRVYFAKSDSSRPSPVAKASAESLLKDRGIPVRNELLLGDKTSRTWQETLAIVWKHLTAPTENSKNESIGDDFIRCNLSATQVVEEIQAMQKESTGASFSEPPKVFVTGSLYLVGSFLTALEWSEDSSPPL